MAIIINGNGTISGDISIATSGATIATSELNTLDGASANLQNQIVSNVWSVNQLPSGSVIQVVRNYDDTVTNAGSGGNFTTTWLETFITLKRSSSIIMIDGVWCGQIGRAHV